MLLFLCAEYRVVLVRRLVTEWPERSELPERSERSEQSEDSEGSEVSEGCRAAVGGRATVLRLPGRSLCAVLLDAVVLTKYTTRPPGRFARAGRVTPVCPRCDDAIVPCGVTPLGFTCGTRNGRCVARLGTKSRSLIVGKGSAS